MSLATAPKGKAESVTEEMGGLVADINALIAQTESMLAESTSQHAVAKLDLLHDPKMKEEISVLMSKFRRTTERLARTLEHADKLARVYPYQASLLALAAGIFLGRAISRRD